jgi:hypothetical protein
VPCVQHFSYEVLPSLAQPHGIRTNPTRDLSAAVGMDEGGRGRLSGMGQQVLIEVRASLGGEQQLA